MESCPHDKYGMNCTETCSCMNGAKCDSATGFCDCPKGWKGSDCSERICPEDKYGKDCGETCECETQNTDLCHPAGELATRISSNYMLN